MRPFKLQPLLNKIESELAPLADAKGLVYRSRETFAAVHSDPALLELILRNLVTNAIRYTTQGGVLVACRARSDTVVLEVWDTGIGIHEHDQQEIFQEFHQLGNPERDRHKGLGLGLAIVDGLAQAMKHQVSLASTPGRGSVFRISLPVTRAPISADDHESTQRAMQAFDAHVLILDDDEAVRTGMSHLLQSWGCTCVEAKTIEEALALAAIQRPQLVVSDYRLRDEYTGTQAIAALRKEAEFQLPAILITGDTGPERLREALSSGIPLLHKPVSPQHLNRTLASILHDESMSLDGQVLPSGPPHA